MSGGTIRVMEGKVINEGEEILMAYNASYWSRWAPRTRTQRKRPRTDDEAGAERATAAGLVGSGRVGGSGGAGSPGVRGLETDGGGHGRRVRGRESREQSVTGKKRGRPLKTVEAGSSGSYRRRTTRQLLWTDTGREEYIRTVMDVQGGEGGAGAGQRFERGEGGGVT